MDNNTTMAIYGGLAILLIFYFVVSFFSGKTWKVTHVLLAVCVFFASGVFFVMAVATLKTHKEWREVYLKLKQEVAETNFQNELIAKGFGRDPVGELHEEESSIRELEEKVDQELYDRARVWRNCSAGTFDGNSITLTVIQPEDAATAGEDLRMADKAILYAFKETQTAEGWKVPNIYLGEFQVDSQTPADKPTAVTLKPTLPLDEAQDAEVKKQDATWALYELMPVDSYQAFACLRDPDAADPDADYRGKIQESLTAAKMGLDLRIPAHQEAYSLLIDEYARDRQPVELGRDPPDRIWKKVRFLKEPEPIKVDSEDEEAQHALRYYDATGRAVPASLRTGDVDADAVSSAGSAEGVVHDIKNRVSQGKIEMDAGEIVFDIGDVALLDGETADKMIADGVAEELEAVFIRELRDYAFQFNEMYLRKIDLNDHYMRVEYDTRTLVRAGDNANIHVTYRTGEKDTLLADVQRFEAERDALAEYLATLQAQHTQLMKDLSLLYRTNNALVADLTRYQYGLARAINERTQQAEPTERAPRSTTPPPTRP